MPASGAGTSNRDLRVATSPSGVPVTVRVTEVVGARPGPTLGLLSGVHGDEGLGPLALVAFLRELDPTTLAGSIIAIPVANTPAFGLRTRTNAWDAGDLIRTWPGRPDGSITERTAHAVFSEVAQRADAIVDLHSGTPVLHEFWSIYGNGRGPGGAVDADVEQRSHDLAVAFGLDQVLRGHPWFGTQMAGAQAGIPTIITEIGGGSDYRDNGRYYLDVMRRGVKNVLIHLGMLEGELTAVSRTCDVFDIAEEFMSRSTGGYWERQVESGTPVEAGTVIGRFLNPQTGEEVDHLAATRSGTVLNATADWPHIGIGQWLLATGERVERVVRPDTVRVPE